MANTRGIRGNKDHGLGTWDGGVEDAGPGRRLGVPFISGSGLFRFRDLGSGSLDLGVYCLVVTCLSSTVVLRSADVGVFKEGPRDWVGLGT